MRRCKKRKIKNRLRQSRKLRGYTQKEVMQILGMKSNNRLSQWEAGARFPGLRNAIKLSILYNTLVDHLFYELREEAIREIESHLRKVDQENRIKNKQKPP
jgi:transcriptional regulator with XRE-family HTH domain